MHLVEEKIASIRNPRVAIQDSGAFPSERFILTVKDCILGQVCNRQDIRNGRDLRM